LRKFTFDNDFDRPNPGPKAAVPKATASEPAAAVPVPPAPSFSEAELAAAVAAARKAALAEGTTQGRTEANAQVERQVATALGAIAKHLVAIDRDVQTTATGLSEIALQVSLAMMRRLFPELTRRHGGAEIEGVLTRCLDTLKTEPRFLIRVPASLLEELRGQIEQLAAAHEYEGRITTVGDDRLQPGDCQVEWSQGGMIRTGSEIQAGIEAAMVQALATIEHAPVAAD
jgi:flagellar assembly protein FliH